MQAPVTLVIDTARDRLGLALMRADGSVDTLVEPVAKGHAEIVMDRIGDLLARNGLVYGDLQRVASVSGPGSFTGLRIGLSVARGLALALDIPAIGAPTLLALSLSEGAGTVVLDAKRGQAYSQSFSAPGVAQGQAELLDFDAALATAGKVVPDAGVVDLAALARFAATADPHAYPPEPTYIRSADAKPQTRGKVARQ